MKVVFEFSIFFSSMIGIDIIEIEIPEQISICDAFVLFLEKNPNYRSVLEKKKLLLNDELRAVYLLNSKFVEQAHILEEGDRLKILKAFVGG